MLFQISAQVNFARVLYQKSALFRSEERNHEDLSLEAEKEIEVRERVELHYYSLACVAKHSGHRGVHNQYITL